MPLGNYIRKQQAKTQDRFDRKMLKAGVMSQKEYDMKKKKRAMKEKKKKNARQKAWYSF